MMQISPNIRNQWLTQLRHLLMCGEERIPFSSSPFCLDVGGCAVKWSPGMNEPRLCGPGKLITRAVFDLDDGRVRVVGGRQFRKGVAHHIAPANAHHRVPHSTWLAFRLAGWKGANDLIAILFMIGSSLFALGAVQAMMQGEGIPFLRSSLAQNVTFFCGSIFFTSAAFLQWRQSVGKDLRKSHLEITGPESWWDWRPRDCGYMAGITQLAGTILFNLNTGDPLLFGGGWVEQDLVVWTPNMIGCILFLVSSVYACIEIGQGFFVFEPRNISWWIAWSNLAGSVFFQISAVASWVLPSTEAAWAATVASLFTALGAGGFFLAAALMIPESRDQPMHPELKAFLSL